MSLPVSQYEALLAEVRGLRRKAQRVQQLATPLISHCSSSESPKVPPFTSQFQDDEVNSNSSYNKMEPLLMGRQQHNSSSTNCDGAASSSVDGDTTCSEDEYGGVRSTHLSVSSEPITHRDRGGGGGGGGISMLYHGTWPVEKTMWNSEPTPHRSTAAAAAIHHHNSHMMQDVTSVMSFASSSGGVPLDRVLGSPSLSRRSSQQQLEAKVDMVYSLLAMLSGQEHADMGETLLALSTNPESCLAMRQSGCIPLLVQILQSDREPEARKKASQALHNLVQSQPDEKMRKREVRVFKLLEHARAYTEALRNDDKEFEPSPEAVTSSSSDDDDRHPVQTVAHLMKLSFDELHRQAICTLGGIHTIAGLVEAEHSNHGSTADEAHCILMRRYACMALTNLTFGDSGNKALLCSFREFMRALVVQLQSPSDELRQVTASVLRNLSWRADSCSKEILREVGSVTGLMKAAMLADNKENTLKSILSALWNLSAHCTENKSEICSVEGALGFLVDALTMRTPAIVENAGGILRNVSSQIAVRDDYREVLRQHDCLQILLDQLKSPSLTVVSNACGTLWNLSAKCPTDQEALWRMGAPAMLRSLNHSKHKMIAMGSSAALKNLLGARPSQQLPPTLDSTAMAMDLPVLPTLGARKQKALLQDLDQTLSETYENIEKESPVRHKDDFTAQKKKYIPSPPNYEPDYSSLNYSEPSTSGYESSSKFSNYSLPHQELGGGGGSKKCFLKTTSSSKAADSGLQSLESPVEDVHHHHHHHYQCISSSSNSIDNDKYRKSSSSSESTKLKEVSVYSDEKDHCSIEDVSDSDTNQSSLGLEHKLHEESAGLLTVRREAAPASSSAVSTPSLPPPKYANLASSNITMFDGDIDEIDMEDISIHFASDAERSKEQEDNSEKQDVEKEKKSMNEEHYTDFIGIRNETWSRHAEDKEEKSVKTPTRSFGSGIPLPRSSPRPIPSSSSSSSTAYCQDSGDGIVVVVDSSTTSSSADIAINSNNSESSDRKTTTTTRSTKRLLFSNLPRRSFQTSTPIAATGSLSRADEEASKVENIDRSLTESTPSEIECSLPAIEPSSSSCLLNDSDEEELVVASKSEEERRLEMEDKPEETSPTTESNCFGSCLNLEDERRDRLLERSCEESNPVDNRMLDPDAMIESLDRFTAELVSQASHLQQSKDEDKYKDNTWNEDTSPNEVTFPSISSNAPNVITFDSNDSEEAAAAVVVAEEAAVKETPSSNDFSSMNTATATTTMTESTLIAIEASKMASVFKNEAEMSHSMSSVASLELDKVQPPSLLDSLSNSDCGKSPPKTTSRRRSLPKGLMVRRALSGNNAGSSVESLSNLDLVNPPSAMADVIDDMEGSTTSVASLPNENLIRTDFVIDGAVTKNNSFLNNNNNNNSSTTSKTGNMMNIFMHNSHMNSVSDLENINPPSLLNEITDLCNSLADVASEAIGSETEMFEDCRTHVDEDVTEFSDANSATPIQSDLASSSPEVSPRKKNKVKQRRSTARDRYRTYTVAPETLLRVKQDQEDLSEDNNYRSAIDDSSATTTTATAATYNVKKRPTPKERRRNDRSRFETQVVEEAITDVLQQPVIDDDNDDFGSSRLNVRKNFMQKRLENKDRFKTQTLTASEVTTTTPTTTFSPEPVDDIHVLVRKEADLVLKSLRETKTTGGGGGGTGNGDELLDCETLSLVSNDDDSEHNNSGSPINYRTYHKSWGMKKNVPVIEPTAPASPKRAEEEVEEVEEPKPEPVAKPKIVKPSSEVEATAEDEPVEEEVPQGKAIRGRRKPLYSKSTPGNKVAPKTLRPIKSMTSNLVKNVASSIKSQVKQANIAKPPVARVIGKSITSPKTTSTTTTTTTTSPKGKPPAAPPPLERQGTFTKDEPVTQKSRIPTTTTTSRTSSKAVSVPPPPPSKIPAKNNNKPPGIPRSINSASSDRANRNTTRTSYYGRSTSADSREPVFGNRKIQSSVSSQSLKNERPPAKRSSIPHPAQRAGSNTSLNSTTTTTTTSTTTSAKKQVTSKIASLWKKIEESKNKQPTKKDTRVWIEQQQQGQQGGETAGLIRSNTFDNKDEVTLRNRTQEENPEKRVSRLGSFIVMDDTEDGARLQQIINAAAME